MANAQGFLYILGVLGLILGGCGVPKGSRVRLALLGAALLALGYVLPAIAHLFA